MKKRGHSNVFTVPKWMQNLRAVEPEGNMTPDQVAYIIELNILLNDNDLGQLRACIYSLVPKVPLKHQKVLKAFIACTDSNMLKEVQAFILQVNTKLAELPKVEEHVEPRRKELCAETSGESPVRSTDSDWGDDWNRSSRYKPRSRGNRAVRAAKRGQAET